jgi:hypothetical protein
MGGPRRPAAAELQRRIQEYGDAWRAVALDSSPADRPRAEAAIAAMYRANGRAAPTIAWAPSPRAGMLAYRVAAMSRGVVGSPFVRGDIGTGDRREWHALAEPFGMDPRWASRLLGNVRRRVGGDVRPTMRAGIAEAAAQRLGFGGTARIVPLVETLSRDPLPMPPVDAGTIVRLAPRTLLEEAWPSLRRVLDEELAAELVARALEAVAERLTQGDGRARSDAQAMQPGQWDVETPVLAAARDVLGGFIWRHEDGRVAHETFVDLRLELARAAGPWWALDGLAIISERPLRISVDDRGRPHAADGPSIAWADGTELWAWHGVRVGREVVLDPGSITAPRVDSEANAEVRRVLVERMGIERLTREGGAELVDEDETGRLWRRRMPHASWVGQEAVVTVEVRNSTPEPDGTRKTYFLRVPPTMSSARAAVAWTFGLGQVEYRPAVET